MITLDFLIAPTLTRILVFFQLGRMHEVWCFSFPFLELYVKLDFKLLLYGLVIPDAVMLFLFAMNCCNVCCFVLLQLTDLFIDENCSYRLSFRSDEHRR